MKLLSFDDLATAKGITFHRSHIWNLIRKGKFPKAIKLGAGQSRCMWLESEIDDWIKAKLAERDSEKEAA